jgi:2-amino-4-hydroxy-6-hydroxymethyldihydropteridine diphosphokinase
MICYIGIGSNLGNRIGYIKKALVLLKKTGAVHLKKISPVYETEPIGGPKKQSWYLNLAAKVRTDLSPEELLILLKGVEKRAGRKTRKKKWSAREIDLDILLCGKRVIFGKDLKVPHPLMHKRFFVLKPLSDIAMNLKHPVFNVSINRLLKMLKPATRAVAIEKAL